MLHPSELRFIIYMRILLSYASPSWATLHSAKLCCTLTSPATPFWSTLFPPSELRCILSTLHPNELYAAPSWVTLHPTELSLLSYAAALHPSDLRVNPAELHCTQLSYAAHYWGICYNGLSFTVPPVLSNAASCWDTLHHMSSILF